MEKKVSTFVKKILLHTPLSVDIAKIIDIYTHFYIYRLGGDTDDDKELPVTDCYKLNIFAPTTEERQWIPIAPMLTVRDIGAVVMIQNRYIYACGGITELPNQTNTVECYDTHTNTWTTCSEMLKPIITMHALSVKENLVIIYKMDNFYNKMQQLCLNVYDSKQNTWTNSLTQPPPIPEMFYHCTNWRNERLYMFGSSFIYYYDIKADSWIDTKSKLSIASSNTQSIIIKDHIAIMGGYQWLNDSLISVDSVELYYPVTGRSKIAEWTIPELDIRFHPIDKDSTFLVTDKNCTKVWIFHYDILGWEPWILPPVPYNFAAQI